MHILSLYLSSKRRQCKLGYDSSPQCDSFQLGEMTRFFAKIGTLQLQGTIFADPADTFPPPYQGEIDQLIVALRQCPAYQVDKNHAHCGLRTRLIPALDPIQGYIRAETGVCRHCWKEDRNSYRWYEGEPVSTWYPREDLPNVSGYSKGSVAICGGGSRGATATKEKIAPSGFIERNGSYRNCKKDHRQARELFTAETRKWEGVT